MLGLGEKTCQALPFFHAFSGCDRWHYVDNNVALTQVFHELSSMPPLITEADLNFREIHTICLLTETCKNL